jgi:transcriptional regulator with XRE-family HTH domain
VSELNFALLIQQRRKELGLSLRGISRLTGISFSTISRLERGVFSPTLDNAAKLASALQITLPNAAGIAAQSTGESNPASKVPEEPRPAVGSLVRYKNIAISALKPGIRRNLSKIAVRNSYKEAILLRGSMQLRTTNGFRENLTPGATIDCGIIIQDTYFAVTAEGAELLWLG